MNVPNILLRGVVGSTAYGLAHAGSDIDEAGIYAAPTTAFHGLNRPAESIVTTEPDVTLHEAGKLCRLALACNPTVGELLWLPDELYTHRTTLGRELVAIRGTFLHHPGVRGAYLGYATQQFRKLISREDGSFSSNTRKRTLKHATHIVRLVEQAVHAHRTGELLVRLPDPERVRATARRIVESPDVARALISDAEDVFDTHASALPPAADREAVEAWLHRVRAAYYVPVEVPA